MTVGTVLLIISILIVLGALPLWPSSKGLGPYPSSGRGLGFVVVILLILVLMKKT